MSAADPYGAVRAAPSRHCRKDRMPVGTVVIRQRTRDGSRARYVKVREDGPPQRRWIQYARWWWQKNKGPVPPGKIVLHVDGDPLNDDPSNFAMGTPGTKLVLAHHRDPKWSREQHRRAAAGTTQSNHERSRIYRARNFLAAYWYPVVDDLGVILNVPVRKQKRLLACFGVDVSGYPMNGRGKNPGSFLQRAIRAAGIRPVRGAELGLRRYRAYTLMNPATGKCSGPMSATPAQLAAALERMGVWTAAQKQARRLPSETR